jgi:hypothetical protein
VALITINSVISIVARLDAPGFQTRQDYVIFLFSETSDRVWVPSSYIFNGYRRYFPSAARPPGNEVGNSPQSKVEVKNVLPYIPPLCYQEQIYPFIISENRSAFRFIIKTTKALYV